MRLHRSLPGYELESLHRVSRLEGFEAIKGDCAPLPGRGRTPSLPGRLEVFDAGSVKISSNELRADLARGGSARGRVPEPVAEYITKHGLYRSGMAAR